MKFGPLMVTLKGKQLGPLDDTPMEQLRATAEKKIIQHPLVGGIILFAYNYLNQTQLLELTQAIKKVAAQANKPIFIAVDHEGGYVQRFERGGFTNTSSAKALGNVYRINPQTGLTNATEVAKVAALEEKGCGVDLILAPVVDLDFGNKVISGLDRSYGKDPLAVTAVAGAFIEGLAQGGMRATLKHFPGHGRNIGDSHETKPVDNRTLEEIRKSDLIPFQRLIELGYIGAIMPAHITYPQVDADHTAGTSKIWLNDILRQEFKFEGVIISDCLSMNGAGDNADLEKTLEALAYGDIALLCHKNPSEYLDLLVKLEAQHLNYNLSSSRIARWLSPVLEEPKPILNAFSHHAMSSQNNPPSGPNNEAKSPTLSPISTNRYSNSP